MQVDTLSILQTRVSLSGIDISKSALRIAEKWRKQEEVGSIALIQAVMTHLPFKDCCFDGEISVSTIHHAISKEIETTIGEIHRTLKKGGLLLANLASVENPRYGTGLIPESAPLVDDITSFWCEYHYGQTLEQWKEQESKTEKRKASKSRKKQIKTQQKPMVIKQIVGSSFDKAYPNTTRWVNDYGWIEIGQTEYSSSLIRVLDEGGMIWESSQDYETMDKAMKALETALADWMKQYKE